MAKKKKKSYLPDPKDAASVAREASRISAAFNVDQIVMKNDLRWRMKLKIGAILPKSYHDYDVSMVFDEDPYHNRIANVEEKIEKVKRQEKLFEEEQESDIDELKEEMKDIENEMIEMSKQCKTISFLAQVQEIKYKGGETIMLMVVPDSIVASVNEVKTFLRYYRIELYSKI